MRKPPNSQNKPGNELTPRRIFREVFTTFLFKDMFVVLCGVAPVLLGAYYGPVWALLAGIADIAGWSYVLHRFVFKLHVGDALVVVGVPGPFLLGVSFGLAWGLAAAFVVVAIAIVVGWIYLSRNVVDVANPPLSTRLAGLMILVMLVLVTVGSMLFPH